MRTLYGRGGTWSGMTLVATDVLAMKCSLTGIQFTGNERRLSICQRKFQDGDPRLAWEYHQVIGNGTEKTCVKIDKSL